MTQFVGLSIYFIAAFGLALALLLVFAGMLHAGTRVRKEPLPWVFFAIVAAIMAAPLATGRVLTAGLASRDASLEDIGSSFWLSRILTVLVVAVAAERVVRYFLRKGTLLQAWPLWWTFFAFAISSQILNSILGAHPSFDHKSLYAFPLYFAFFVVAQQDPERVFRIARWALLMFLVGGAVTAMVRPGAVIEFAYTGGLPGITFRYYGLATHANTLGPLAITFMIVLWRFPFPARWFTLSAWTLAAGSLLLSQSKTSIAIAGGIGLFLVANRYRMQLPKSRKGGSVQFGLFLWACTCVVLALVALGILVGSNYTEWVVGKLDTITNGQWATLSGRTRVWALAWHEYLSHPLFGYGPTIWNPEYRFYAQIPAAFHAHNQLLQTLSSAGSAGGIAFLAYAFTLGVYAVRANHGSGGISIALVALMLFRCISEVPFSTASVMQSEFINHILALCACAGFAVRPVSAAQRTSGKEVLRAASQLPAASLRTRRA